MVTRTQHMFDQTCPLPLAGFTNGRLYVRTKEVFGILPVPDETRILLGMLPCADTLATLAAGQGRDTWLAARQNTKYALLPVDTSTERTLFRERLKEHQGGRNATREPDWIAMSRAFNAAADGVLVFYKVSCFRCL